uniref:Uncharacterized protein n=1 Tax=Setaria digitata TaxID=48799 RepID=A0A915Q6H5_9BILA
MEILKLLHDMYLNINKMKKQQSRKKLFSKPEIFGQKFEAKDCDDGSAVRLREELRGRNDTVGLTETEPCLPNSVLLASRRIC